jgi:hypothetical protein
MDPRERVHGFTRRREGNSLSWKSHLHRDSIQDGAKRTVLLGRRGREGLDDRSIESALDHQRHEQQYKSLLPQELHE